MHNIARLRPGGQVHAQCLGGRMMQWMILPFKRYFDFQGRSRRLEFWMFALFNVIVYSVIGILIVATGSTADRLGAADPNDPASVKEASEIFNSVKAGEGQLASVSV
mgnify:CR=1 FL=1